jgi:hypothetical protein
MFLASGSCPVQGLANHQTPIIVLIVRVLMWVNALVSKLSLDYRELHSQIYQTFSVLGHLRFVIPFDPLL